MKKIVKIIKKKLILYQAGIMIYYPNKVDYQGNKISILNLLSNNIMKVKNHQLNLMKE